MAVAAKREDAVEEAKLRIKGALGIFMAEEWGKGSGRRKKDLVDRKAAFDSALDGLNAAVPIMPHELLAVLERQEQQEQQEQSKPSCNTSKGAFDGGVKQHAAHHASPVRVPRGPVAGSVNTGVGLSHGST